MAKVKANTEIPKTPLWETYARKPLSNGRIQGIDGSMWLLRSVPMGSVIDAKTTDAALAIGQPIATALDELRLMASQTGLNRGMVQKSYRHFQILLTNFPRWYKAPKGHPIENYLDRSFGDTEVLDRRVMFAVKLIPTTGSGSFKSFMESVQQTLFEGGTPLSDYDKDVLRVDAALARAGLTVPEPDAIRAAEAWWNHGRTSDTPVTPHPEHLHFFRSMQSAEIAEREGLADCEPWLDVEQHMAVSFASVSEFDLGYTKVSDPNAWWIPGLLDRGARVISIRGFVEPPQITRQELKSQRRRVRNDLQEAAEKGKTDQAALKEAEAELDSIEQTYDVNKTVMPATIVDTSILVGFAGVHRDVKELSHGVLTLHPMTNRQLAAWHETMLCSNVRANPNQHDLPSTTIAFSGLPNLSVVGDDGDFGALLGFTSDQQPSYLSATAASAGDAAPTMLGGAATGSGKTVLLQWIAMQHAMMGRPVIIIDPKMGSDLSSVVARTGGRVVSLDDFVSSDGGLDPLGLFPTPAMGIPLASSMLFRVNPWGDERRRGYEADIANALMYGVANGATATGQALKMAYDAGVVPAEVVADVFKVAETYPMFRATFGMQPSAGGLNVAQGITLFKVGKTSLDLPPAGVHMDVADMDASMRQSVNIIRMLVRGSMLALAGRGGVLHMDEAWIIERSAPDELNEIGRLARSQNVLPVLYTQTPSGPLNLGLKGYISRGLIGHISDESEAMAALDLFKADSPEILRRVTDPESLSGAVNWNSLKALRNAQGEVIRGAMFYYADLKQRIAPVEVKLPSDFFTIATTRPDEVRAREAAAHHS